MPRLRLKAYGIAALVFALDRLTKWVVETYVSAMDTYHVIPGFFDIVHSENRGVAFGILNDSTSEWRTTMLVVLSGAAVIFVTAMLWNAQRLDRFRFHLCLVDGKHRKLSRAAPRFKRAAYLERHVFIFHKRAIHPSAFAVEQDRLEQSDRIEVRRVARGNLPRDGERRNLSELIGSDRSLLSDGFRFRDVD